MSTFDRMEIIAEIEALAESLGMERMTVLSKLADLPDNDLLRRWSAMKNINEVTMNA